MKKIALILILTKLLLADSQGDALYNSCKFCHGYKGEKKYMNVVEPISRLDKKSLVYMLKEYKKGTLDNYGYGNIMKMQMRNVPDNLIDKLAQHIKELK
ncbi:cytochrome c [Sulfurospirillum sp. 1307]|jgi:cytochrome c553